MIATHDVAPDVAACLGAIEPQLSPSTEVLVVDGSRDGTGELIERGFPWVCLSRDASGAGLAELRATGLAKARGEIVAFVDAYSQVCADWVERLRAADWSRFAAIGGVVAPASCRTLTELAAFLCDYGSHLPSRPAGPATILPGNNVGFRRDALERAGFIGEREFWKTFALGRLAERGEQFWVDPDLVVRRRRASTARSFARERYLHGRCFGANRVAGRPYSYRLSRAASCLVVPPLLTARLGRDVLPDRQYRGAFCRSLAHLLVFNAAWALGEADGYLRGGGDACRQLT